MNELTNVERKLLIALLQEIIGKAKIKAPCEYFTQEGKDAIISTYQIIIEKLKPKTSFEQKLEEYTERKRKL